MKFIRYIQTLGMAVSLLMATAAALAAGPSYRLAVDGLACPFCAYGIEKKLTPSLASNASRPTSRTAV